MIPAKQLYSAFLATLLLSAVILISSFRQESKPQSLWYCFKEIYKNGESRDILMVASARTREDAERIFDRQSATLSKGGALINYVVSEIGNEVHVCSSKSKQIKWTTTVFKPAP